jgi:hypothetical protein
MQAERISCDLREHYRAREKRKGKAERASAMNCEQFKTNRSAQPAGRARLFMMRGRIVKRNQFVFGTCQTIRIHLVFA